MKVKCIKNVFKSEDPEVPFWYPDLSIDKIYHVLAIQYDDYRLIGDEERPYLYPQQAFSIIDNQIDNNWIQVFEEEEEGEVLRYYGPPEFARYFFEDYFDGDREKKEIFEQYIKQLKLDQL